MLGFMGTLLYEALKGFIIIGIGALGIWQMGLYFFYHTYNPICIGLIVFLLITLLFLEKSIRLKVFFMHFIKHRLL